MKILNRSDFLLLPPGIFFSPGERWGFDGFCIKGDTIFDEHGTGIDFIYHNLVDFIWGSSEERDRIISAMLYSGLSVPINKSEHRDGSFDNKVLFLIFEEEDLLYIRSFLPEGKEETIPCTCSDKRKYVGVKKRCRCEAQENKNV